MRVLFSNPPWWEKNLNIEGENLPNFAFRSGVRAGSRWPHTVPSVSAPDYFNFGGYLPYPFFMGYAANWMAHYEKKVDVTFRDSIALRESYKSYYRFIADNFFDYIFIETAQPSWESDRQIIHQVKKLQPDTKIVLCGPIATNGEKILAEEPVHAALKGEYEKNAIKIINGQEGVLDYDLLTTEEMNNGPFFYMDDQIVNHYYDGISASNNYKPPELQVWTSRGCPYKCIFCVWPAVMTSNDPDGTNKRRVRQYSADYLEALLREYVDRFKVKTIYFDDDTFNLGDRHVENVCSVMDKIGLPWAAMCRADTNSLDHWQMMKDSGCYKVKIGFESGNQWVLDNIVNKRLDLEKARDVVSHISKIGIKVHGTFTYGLPGETREQMLDTKAYIESLDLNSYQESGTAIVEGTPLSTLIEKKKLDKFQGATVDDDFLQSSDGAEKIRDLNLPDVKNTSASSASFGVNASTEDEDFKWASENLIRIIHNISIEDKVALWGLNQDFISILNQDTRLSELIKSPNIHLFDKWSSEQFFLNKEIRDPKYLADFNGVIVFLPRNPNSRANMHEIAHSMNLSENQIIDLYADRAS